MCMYTSHSRYENEFNTQKYYLLIGWALVSGGTLVATFIFRGHANVLGGKSPTQPFLPSAPYTGPTARLLKK